jgi:hypothetical protein
MASWRWTQGLLGMSIVSLAAATLQSGCAESESAFFIEAVGNDPSGGCECPAAEAERLVSGSFAPTVASDFVSCVSIRSNLAAVADEKSNYNRTETNDVIIYAYDLVVSAPGGTYTGTFQAGGVLPAGNETGLVMALPLIPQEAVTTLGLGTELVTDVNVSISLYGRTTGGVEVDTPSFSYGVSVFGVPPCECEAAEDTCRLGSDKFPACEPGTFGCPEAEEGA